MIHKSRAPELVWVDARCNASMHTVFVSIHAVMYRCKTCFPTISICYVSMQRAYESTHTEAKMVFVNIVMVWVDAMLFVSIQNHIMSKNTFWSIQSLLYLYHVMHTFIFNTMRYIYHTYLQSYKTLERKKTSKDMVLIWKLRHVWHMPQVNSLLCQWVTKFEDETSYNRQSH